MDIGMDYILLESIVYKSKIFRFLLLTRPAVDTLRRVYYIIIVSAQ